MNPNEPRTPSPVRDDDEPPVSSQRRRRRRKKKRLAEQLDTEPSVEQEDVHPPASQAGGFDEPEYMPEREWH